MIIKDFIHESPRLEQFLDRVSRFAVTMRLSVYIGNGTSSHSIDINTNGMMMMIVQRIVKNTDVMVPVDIVFAYSFNLPVSYVFGGVSILDGIVGIEKDVVTVGSNVAVNGSGLEYIIIGMG